MIKRFLNCIAWIWLTGFTGTYMYVCVTEGLFDAIECSSLDEVGTFITALASLVLIVNHFIIPDIQKIELILAGIARKRRHKKMFTSYTQITE